MRSAEPLLGDQSLLPGRPIPIACSKGEPLWNPIGDQVPTGGKREFDLYSIALGKKRHVELPPEPEDWVFGMHDGSRFWDLLEGWAHHNSVDPDLALLACACATAHAAGVMKLFPGGYHRPTSAPTLVARADDPGFHQAVQAAIAPIRQIERELDKTYAPLRRKRKASAKHTDDMFDFSFLYRTLRDTPCKDLDPNTQPSDVVKFLVEGEMPKMPCRVLINYHRHTAMSVGAVEKLPQTTQARENRLYALAQMIEGYRYGMFAIRGFIRFSKEDFDWSITRRTSFIATTLPISSIATDADIQRTDLPVSKEGFDRLHRLTIRRALRLRFDGANPQVVFSDEKAAEHHRDLRASYLREMPAVGHVIPLSASLYDLIVWYLLHLTMASSVMIEPTEITGRALASARRLRRRIAEIHDGQSAMAIGRMKQRQMLKLLHRMERLGRPSTPRDLARGLNKQKMSVINPLIDFLVEHRVFIRENGRLMCEADSRETFDRIAPERFMPALIDVPVSLTGRLERSEQRERERMSSSQITPTPTETPCQS